MPLPNEPGIPHHNIWRWHKILKRKTEQIIAELNNGKEGDHPSQT
jgi:hypothetical protein